MVGFQNVGFPVRLYGFGISSFLLQAVSGLLEEVGIGFIGRFQPLIEVERFGIMLFAEMEVGNGLQQLRLVQDAFQKGDAMEGKRSLEGIAELAAPVAELEETVQVVDVLVTDDFGTFGILFQRLGLLVVHHVVQFLRCELVQHEVALRLRQLSHGEAERILVAVAEEARLQNHVQHNVVA